VADGFVSALTLNEAFYRDEVRPLLSAVPHSAALLGWGSDVLGYDTARSTDHGWGPRLLVFLRSDNDVEGAAAALEGKLPETYAGWPVRYGWDQASERHWVTVTTLPAWLLDHLGVDANRSWTTSDWLVTPQQRLLGVVAGAVYADPAGDLTAVRQRLAWYPEQIWRWLLACQWHRVAQEEAFVARTAEVGDRLGSVVTANRQARELMRLALLLARRYAPYQKWLGTAFARLAHADGLPDHLRRAVTAADPSERQAGLAAAYAALAERHNSTGLTPVVPPIIGPYHRRAAQVLMADRFTHALLETVDDPWLRRLPLIGSIDQHTDSTDVHADPRLYRRTATLYDPLLR
jgi:Domain of unknown function (DUF4037)